MRRPRHILAAFAAMLVWAACATASAAPAAGAIAARAKFHYRERLLLPKGQRVEMRPIMPSDLPGLQRLFDRMSAYDREMRYLGPTKQLPKAEFVRNDRARGEMAFVVTPAGKRDTILGVVRSWTLPDKARAEYALMVDSTMHRQGLGRVLTQKMIDYARHRGLRQLVGIVHSENDGMKALARKMGFEVSPPAGGIHEILLRLR